MKKYFAISCFLLLSIGGCVTIETSSQEANKKALTQIARVKTGMLYQDVKAIMGDKIVIGFNVKGSALTPIEMDNPVRIEKVNKDNKTYFVLYYFTKVVTPDGLMSEDELTPLVFEAKDPKAQEIGKEDVLTGKGSDDVFRLKN